jgi:hypothetical protein
MMIQILGSRARLPQFDCQLSLYYLRSYFTSLATIYKIAIYKIGTVIKRAS